MSGQTKRYSVPELEKIANDIREDIIKMLLRAGSGHSAGPLGLADIFTALYFDVLEHKPHDPNWPERDILVLSNGHCVPVRYAAMTHAGYFPREELLTLRQFGSRLQGHPERLRLPGLETTSGPLGSGLSQAVGMAIGLKIDSVTHRWVYCVMSDGELDEGNSWEAVMLAAKYKLNNLIAIVDRNNIQIEGPTETVMPLENLVAKWQAFGWQVLEIDGNDIAAVIKACDEARAIENKPVVIIAHTVPGKGVDFMENDYHWHSRPFKPGEAQKALAELRTLRGKIKSEHE